MNILFYRYGSICEPDLLKAFRSFSINVTECTVEISQKHLSSSEKLTFLMPLLSQRHFQFIFSVNYFPFLSEVCERLHLLYVCWSVDCPVLELFSKTVLNRCNRIFLFDRMQYERFHKINPDCIFYLPLATSVSRWNEVLSGLTDDDREKYRSDLSFVGSLYHEKSPLSLLNPPSLSPYWEGYVRGICEAQLKINGSSFMEETVSPSFIAYLKETFPDFYRGENTFCNPDAYVASQYYIGMHLAELERVRTLNFLAENFPVDLYTNSSPSLLKNVQCHKGVSTHFEMPKIFHLSKINLNITMRSIESGLSLRIWDVLGCEGFLISNFQNEIPDYFTIGEDLECYENPEELKEKIQFYLNHEDIRREIAHNGYLKVQKFHTFELRIASILKTVCKK